MAIVFFNHATSKDLMYVRYAFPDFGQLNRDDVLTSSYRVSFLANTRFLGRDC